MSPQEKTLEDFILVSKLEVADSISTHDNFSLSGMLKLYRGSF